MHFHLHFVDVRIENYIDSSRGKVGKQAQKLLFKIRMN